MDLSKILKKLEKIDLYIVSHGGVGSNYIVEYLKKKNNIKTIHNDNYVFYGITCHFPYLLSDKKKTIYIYGDILNSIVSQYHRHLIYVNAYKMNILSELSDNTNITMDEFLTNQEKYTLEYFLNKYPDDPIGIKNQWKNFKEKINNENLALLKYPYTKYDLQHVLNKFEFNLDISDFEIIQRTSNVINIEDYKEVDIHLYNILKIYENFEFI